MSTTQEQPTGIEGLKGREPIGAALTIGIKGDRGFPIERDRFHVVLPFQDGEQIKPAHPNFKRFNDAPPAHRKMVEGMLVHSSKAECFHYNLRNQSPRKVKAQDKPAGSHPYCAGDGKTAQRWSTADGGAFKSIVCPHEKCEFRQKTVNDKGVEQGPDCKPFMTLLFQLRIPWRPEVGSEFPTMMVKFSSAAWSTTSALLGLFDKLERDAKALGLTNFSLLGFKFTLTLLERRSVDGKNKFPSVIVTPIDDPLTFLSRQREQFAQLGAVPRAALTDRTMDDVNSDYDDYAPGRGGKVIDATTTTTVAKPGALVDEVVPAGVDKNHPAWRDLGGDADGSP